MTCHCLQRGVICRQSGVCLLAVFFFAVAVEANQAGGKSDSQVKLSATGGKIEANGRQQITITMEVNNGWHAYANEVKHEDYEPNRTEVKITGSKKLEAVTISYPPGEKHVVQHADGKKDIFQVYEGRVIIQATVTRAAGDTGPLEVSVRYMTCNDKECLLPETVKLQVK